MSHKEKDNKEHYSSQAKWTSTKKRKRPSRERGPYGENTGTVQKRDQRTTIDKEGSSGTQPHTKTARE